VSGAFVATTPATTDAKELFMPAPRFPTFRERRIAKTLAATVLVVGILLIMANVPSPIAPEDVAPPATPAATTAPDAFTLPPALLQSREPEFSAPTF
jgi:hypothetical protein